MRMTTNSKVEQTARRKSNDITKQEVVSRQLETAIVLFFCDDDAISIHVLASAASQILYDVRKNKGKVSIRDF